MTLVMFVVFLGCSAEFCGCPFVVGVILIPIMSIILIYCIGFLRYSSDADRWFAPTQPLPWLGALGCVWIFSGILGAFLMRRTTSDKMDIALLTLVPVVVMLWLGNFTYACGF